MASLSDTILDEQSPRAGPPPMQVLPNKPTPPKPLLRGVLDGVAALVALPATFVLVSHATAGRVSQSAAVYGFSLLFLLSASTLYHWPTWQPRARKWMQRIDHAAIFVLIAGTYTPVCIAALPASSGTTLLIWIWSLAAVGIVVSLAWPKVPRLINVILCIGMGWVAAAYGEEMIAYLSSTDLGLLFFGGLFYSGGAIAYGLRWPNPWPRVYGYHEFFHTGVITAAVLHFIAVWNIVG